MAEKYGMIEKLDLDSWTLGLMDPWTHGLLKIFENCLVSRHNMTLTLGGRLMIYIYFVAD